jgi:type I restriction enzyme S subunit
MSKYEIVIPPQEVAFAFNQQIVPLVDTIQNNIFQSRTLAELRDTLLPKLISGQLRVPDAVKLVGGTQ